MRSDDVATGETIFPQDINAMRDDARLSGALLVHQQLGVLAIGTQPTTTHTITLTVNGTAIVLTAVSAIGSTAGNFLIGTDDAHTLVNLMNLLANPGATTTTQVALSAANQQLLSYLDFAIVGTSITISSLNRALSAPLTSFTCSTTIVSATYTAQTMQLFVEPGVYWINGTKVSFAGGSTPTVTAPSVNPRIDVLTIDSSGTLAWTTGAEAGSPTAPAYPINKLPLVEITNVVSETQLLDNANQSASQGFISSDVRPALTGMPPVGAFSADLIPDADGTRNLGSVSKEWSNGYFKNGIFLNGVSVNSQITTAFTAAEAIVANNAVSTYGYQTDGGVLLDTNATGTVTASGTTATVTNPITVGANSNRVIVVFLMSGASGATCTWNGTSVPQVDQQQQNSGGTWSNTYLLVAPATGAHNLVFSGVGSGASIRYFIYSYYNAKQTGQPDAHTIATGTTSGGASLTPTSDGSLVVGAIYNMDSSTLSTTGIPNNQLSANGWTGSTTQSIVAGDFGQVFPKIAQSSSGTGAAANRITASLISIAPFTAPTYDAVVKSSSLTSGQRNAGFVGFAVSGVSAGSPVTVVTNGYCAGFSGLTPLAQYYLNDTNGTIGITQGTNMRKVGIAISTTELIITNIW